jgi:hypothetical protein
VVGVRLAAKIAAGMAVALVAMMAIVGPVFAECSRGDDDPRLDIRYVFEATVAEASDQVGPPVPGNADFDWHVRLAVERRYEGRVPDVVKFDGWDSGCASILGGGLSVGDRLLIGTERFVPTDLPRSPLVGDLLIWRQIDGAWSLYDEAINWNPEDKWLTRGIEDASTRSAILHVLRSALPDTATSDPGRLVRQDPTPLLLIVFALSGLGISRHLRQRNVARGE